MLVAEVLQNTTLTRLWLTDLQIFIYVLVWRAGPPQFLKERSENAGANENLSCGFPSIPGIAPGVAPRILVSVLLKSWDAIPRVEFRIPRMNFEFRELLREYPRTFPELREWPFCSESVFPEIVRDKFLLRGFCTSGTRIWGRILRNEFWTPEFWTQIPGSNFLTLFFSSKSGPLKNSPSRNSPPKIHLPKLNPEIGPKNSHGTSAGPFG